MGAHGEAACMPALTPARWVAGCICAAVRPPPPAAPQVRTHPGFPELVPGERPRRLLAAVCTAAPPALARCSAPAALPAI